MPRNHLARARDAEQAAAERKTDPETVTGIRALGRPLVGGGGAARCSQQGTPA